MLFCLFLHKQQNSRSRSTNYEHHRISALIGGEFDDMSLPRSVVNMCLISTRYVQFGSISPLLFLFVFAHATQLARTVSKSTHTLSTFPAFVSVCFCACNTTRSNCFPKHTHALDSPVSDIRETNNNPCLHEISYRSRRGPLSALPPSLPVPRMKRLAFDVASCSR